MNLPEILYAKVAPNESKIIYSNIEWAVYTEGYEGLKKLSEPGLT